MVDTLRGLLARERRSDASALHAVETGREYDFHRLLTNAWKTGNLLHQCGVRCGGTVGICGRKPESILSFLGAASLGATVRFDPPSTLDARAVVGPTETIPRFDLPPGGTPIAYGEEPDDPGTRFFERDVWSQNPTLAPSEVAPDDSVLETSDGSLTHAELLAAAEIAIERTGIGPRTTVAVRAPLSLPGTIAAGIVAPLSARGTILFPNATATGAVAVATEPAPEDRTLDPRSLF